MITILFSVLLVLLYRTGQMAQHGKLSDNDFGFFGKDSWIRKYKDWENLIGEERWPTSTTLTVFLTDWYHLSQFLFLRCLNVIIASNMPGNFWLVFGISWVGVSGLMWATEKLATRSR